MTPAINMVMKSGRAALLALTLGAATVTAMPAQAQEPSFSFRFGIDGGGNNFAFGIRDGKKFRRECLTNSEIRRGLSREGFRDIRFLDRSGVRVKVYAEHRRGSYVLTLNRCTGRVTDVERVRRGINPGRPGMGGPGIGFEFRF